MKLDRRQFLAAAALTVAGAACSGGSKKGGASPATAPGATGAPGPQDDLATVAHAAGLEKLTLDTYTGMSTMFTQGRLGAALPQAVVETLAAAGRQHGEHLNTWNKVLTAAGRPIVNRPDPVLAPVVDAAVGSLGDVPAAATLALRMEDYLSQSYLKVLPTLTSPDLVRTTAQIVVVDHQHQAVLRYLLGLSPVGSGESGTAMNFAPADPRPDLITG